MGAMMKTILDYMKQPSTYKGLGVLLGMAGYTFAPGALEAIGGGIVAVIGLWETLRNEKKL